MFYEKTDKSDSCEFCESQPWRVWCGLRVRGAATGRALGTGRRRVKSLSSSGAQSGPRFTSRRRRSAALAIFISRPLGEGGESGAVRPPIAALVATSRTHPLPPRAAFCYRCVHSRVRHRPTLICIPASSQSPNGCRRTRTHPAQAPLILSS